MNIGIPKEIKAGERRIALTPEACAELIARGHCVYLEAGAGERAGFADSAYARAGATIASDTSAVYAQAQLLVKVKEPQAEEWPYLQPHHLLFCYLHLAANPALTHALETIGLTAIAFETVRDNGKTPLLAPMSAIAGRLSVHIGAHYLQVTHRGRGVLLGGTSDCGAGQVMVIGIGVAGLEAASLAHGMGAQVIAIDINPERLTFLHKQYPDMSTHLFSPAIISQLLPHTDLVIGAIYVPGKHAPRAVTAAQVQTMPQGSVVVDIAIDQGGCIETSRPCTHDDPVYIKHGVIHSAITNLPAAVPHTASTALSRAILPYLVQLANGEWTSALTQGINVAQHQLKITF